MWIVEALKDFPQSSQSIISLPSIACEDSDCSTLEEYPENIADGALEVRLDTKGTFNSLCERSACFCMATCCKRRGHGKNGAIDESLVDGVGDLHGEGVFTGDNSSPITKLLLSGEDGGVSSSGCFLMRRFVSMVESFSDLNPYFRAIV